MEITLNGATRTIPARTSASDLIESLGLTNERLALEVNRAIVPRSTFNEHMIRPGDTVEIVRAIGGG